MLTTGGSLRLPYSLPLAVSADGTAVVGKAQEGHSISGNYIFETATTSALSRG
jgi:hypothetical protein